MEKKNKEPEKQGRAISVKAMGYVVIALFVAVIGFDIYLAMDGLTGNTYSEIIRTRTNSWWWLGHLITAGMGLLAWHFFRNNILPGEEVRGRKSRHLLNLLFLVLAFIIGIAFCELIGFY